MGKYVSFRSGGTQIPERSFGYLGNAIVAEAGVYDISGNQLKVQAQDPASTNVEILPGEAFFIKGETVYHGYLDDVDGNEVIAIPANASGNPRIDSIVAYIDMSKTSAPDLSADLSNILIFVRVQGTPGASPSAPDDTAIQTAIGAGNPYVELARVTVPNGYPTSPTTITADRITDVRSPALFKFASGIKDTTLQNARINGSVQNHKVLADATTITMDLADCNSFEVVLGGNRTIAVSNAAIGKYFALDLVQDANGSRTVTWFSGIKWRDGVTPTLTPTANKRDSFIFKCIGDGSYIGYTVDQNL